MLETMAKNLKRYRQFQGLTQSELGKRVGLSKDTISKIELAKQENVGIKYLHLICKELKIGIEQLFIEGTASTPTQIIISDKNAESLISIIAQAVDVLRKKEEKNDKKNKTG